MKSKIMYLTHTAKVGGAEKSLYNLIKNIDDKQYYPILVCGEDGELADMVRDLGVEVHIIPMKQINTKYKIGGIFRLISTSIDLRKFIKDNHIDIVHNNTYRARFFGTISGTIANVKVITHIRDIMHWTYVEKKLVKFEDKIIAISDAVKEHIFKQISTKYRSKIYRIYNGVDINEFDPTGLQKYILRNEYSIDKDKIIIGAVGRFDEWKRFDLLIEAANLLNCKYDNLYFVIVGDAFNEEQEKVKAQIKKLVNKYKLENQVIFTGYRKDVCAVMNDFDIFILTSDNEPFGRVLIEALSLNLPIVSTNNGGAPEIIKNELNGVLVQYNDIESLTQGITYILEDVNTREYMKENNRLYAKQHFSIQTHVSMVQNLYK